MKIKDPVGGLQLRPMQHTVLEKWRNFRHSFHSNKRNCNNNIPFFSREIIQSHNLDFAKKIILPLNIWWNPWNRDFRVVTFPWLNTTTEPLHGNPAAGSNKPHEGLSQRELHPDARLRQALVRKGLDDCRWAVTKPWLFRLYRGDERLPSYTGIVNKPWNKDPY